MSEALHRTQHPQGVPRTRRSRLAFVVALAGVGGAAASCAASVTPHDPDAGVDDVSTRTDVAPDGRPRDDVVVREDVATGDAQPECPAERPVEGAACPVDMMCLYPRTDACTPVHVVCSVAGTDPQRRWRWTPRCVIGPLEPPDMAA